jgi:hypothetical protein
MIAVSVLVLSPALCNAQEPTRLQCEGTYDNYTIAGAREIPIKGIYLEISGERVKVEGALGFNATYSIITRKENGIGFQLESNQAYGGFLNRFSGQLSLMEKASAETVNQTLTAFCSKARPLF